MSEHTLQTTKQGGFTPRMTKAKLNKTKENIEAYGLVFDCERMLKEREKKAYKQGKKDALEIELNYYKLHYHAVRTALKRGESKDKSRKQYLQFELFITEGTIGRLEQRIKEMEK